MRIVDFGISWSQQHKFELDILADSSRIGSEVGVSIQTGSGISKLIDARVNASPPHCLSTALKRLSLQRETSDLPGLIVDLEDLQARDNPIHACVQSLISPRS